MSNNASSSNSNNGPKGVIRNSLQDGYRLFSNKFNSCSIDTILECFLFVYNHTSFPFPKYVDPVSGARVSISDIPDIDESYLGHCIEFILHQRVHNTPGNAAQWKQLNLARDFVARKFGICDTGNAPRASIDIHRMMNTIADSIYENVHIDIHRLHYTIGECNACNKAERDVHCKTLSSVTTMIEATNERHSMHGNKLFPYTQGHGVLWMAYKLLLSNVNHSAHDSCKFCKVTSIHFPEVLIVNGLVLSIPHRPGDAWMKTVEKLESGIHYKLIAMGYHVTTAREKVLHYAADVVDPMLNDEHTAWFFADDIKERGIHHAGGISSMEEIPIEREGYTNMSVAVAIYIRI